MTNAKVTTKKVLDKQKLISMYMEYVLEHEKHPKTVYKFSKENNIQEEDFYNFFGSFEGLQKGVWEEFYYQTILVMSKSPEFAQFDNREKLLTFYYTFFELLAANRSYVLFTLKQHQNKFKNLEQLKGLRKRIKTFASGLIEEGNKDKPAKVLKQSETFFSEAAWVQFLFLLNFWIDDNSAQFESTDIAIEKSVNTVFDVFDTTPLDRVIDFGKFLWKEKMA